MTRDEVLSRSGRVRVRYMAARHPHLPTAQLAEAILDDLGRPAGLRLADVRLILQGRSLADPTRVVERLPIEALQMVGAVISRGGSLAAAARATGLSIDTVRAVERVVMLRADRRAVIADAVRRARADGASVRQVAHNVGLSRGTAHRWIREVAS